MDKIVPIASDVMQMIHRGNHHEDDELPRSSLQNISEFLASTYYALAVLAMLVGVIIWVVRMEGKLTDLIHQNEILSQRLSDLDVHGTRALSDRVNVQAERLSNMENRLNSHVAHMDSWEGPIHRIDIIAARQDEVFRRLETLEKRLDQLDRAHGGKYTGGG